ncbi:MAG: hypothetical protein HYS71_00165 [Candidatus Omnitrophica bacterium]|nr:hypothetical protein [Candidatus Omnitrophota bacterium]MBI2495317.1 hypothetical protein [Candidatus Omnitrophota bacterium]
MRRTIPWLIIVGWVGVAAGFLLRDRYPSAPAPVANAPAPQASMAPATTGRVAHTFADEASVQAFVALWQQRQGILVRLAMLEDYGKNEQLTLQQLDSSLRSQYALDPEGRYTIDTDQRAILKEEASTVAEAVASAPAGAKRETAPKGKGKTKTTTAPSHGPQQKERVHAFADDAAMEEFMNLWRQRQGAMVRMDVLRAYWESEKSRLDQLNRQFATDYQVDVTKPYTLDEQRHALIEHEPPPVPQLPPTPPAVSDSMQKDTGQAGAPPMTAQEPPVPQDQ